MPELKLINPEELDTDFPYVVIANSNTSLFSFLIKWRTRSSWNHVMMLHKPGMLASQNMMYKEVPLTSYLKPHTRLKFWKLKISDEQRQQLLTAIEEDLKDPWYKRIYDFPGILGQALGIRAINNPFAEYCSERLGKRLKGFLTNLESYARPGEVDSCLQESPYVAELVGYWENE